MFACQYCGGLEAFIIAGAIAAWGWGCYMLARVFGWLRPVKPVCQSCGNFISCSMAQVKKCPKSKPWYRRWW
jgi:hypothetical protein